MGDAEKVYVEMRRRTVYEGNLENGRCAALLL